MQAVFDEIDNWVNGVNTSASPDSLSEGFSPRGRNSTLSNIGTGTAQPQKRRGMLLGNVTPVTGSPVMLGQFQYKKLDGTLLHLVVSDNGRLDKYDAAGGTMSVINASAFTAGPNWPSFAVANNFCFITNGVNAKKTDGTTLFNFGITRPAAPTATIAAGGAMSLGAWDVALTYFNSASGHESSLSDFTTVTTTGGNQQINISWAAPSDPQVTHVRVYLRNQLFGANVYLTISGLTPAPDATFFGFVPATTATVANVSDTAFQAFKVIAPTTSSNNPPTATWQYPVWHASRLFLFDQSNAYYTPITNLTPDPESFDALNNKQPINPGDGDVIVGAISALETLFIFKRYSTWKIVGNDPQSWVVSKVSSVHGAASHRGIIEAAGTLYWWTNGSMGPVALADPNAQPLELGKELISTTVSDAVLNNVSLSSVCAAQDEANEHVVWAVPEAGNTRNTLLIPFSYRLKRFVSDGWNPMDVASMCVVEDVAATKSVFMGGYAGQLFKWWAATNDGGTASGSVTSATGTTLVDSLAAFSTTGGKLIERYVYAISSDGSSVQRRRITGNTATTLSTTPAWTTIPNASYTYVVGGIQFEWDSPESKSQGPFYKKRYEFAFLEGQSQDAGLMVYLDIFLNGDTSVAAKTRIFTPTNTSGLYDAATSLYDVTKFGSQAEISKRTKVGRTGKSYRFRVRHLQADKDFTLTKLAMQASILSTKS